MYELKHDLGQGSAHDYPNPITDVLVVCDVCLTCVVCLVVDVLWMLFISLFYCNPSMLAMSDVMYDSL